MTAGKLIAISGPAAAGKSTIARAIQKYFARERGELWLEIELDVFARALSRDWIGIPGRRGRQASRGFIYAPAEDGSIQLQLGLDGRRVLTAFSRSVAAVVNSGMNVVCETVVHDDEDWRGWQESLSSIKACWVKLGAPIAVLEAREQAEPTRIMKGLARGMASRPPVGQFDVEADTSVEDRDALVQRIVRALEG